MGRIIPFGAEKSWSEPSYGNTAMPAFAAAAIRKQVEARPLR
jgi:hypothetical protein